MKKLVAVFLDDNFQFNLRKKIRSADHTLFLTIFHFMSICVHFAQCHLNHLISSMKIVLTFYHNSRIKPRLRSMSKGLEMCGGVEIEVRILLRDFAR